MLPSLTGVKGPSGCAVRQNSKSDLVQGPVVLELEEGPIALLTLRLLYRRRSNRQAAAMMTIQVMEIRTSAATIEILARPSKAVLSTSKQSRWSDLERAAPAGIQERGQVLEVDLPRVLNQNSGRSTHALEHDPAPSRIGSLQVGRLLVPWNLLG